MPLTEMDLTNEFPQQIRMGWCSIKLSISSGFRNHKSELENSRLLLSQHLKPLYGSISCSLTALSDIETLVTLPSVVDVSLQVDGGRFQIGVA
jgi:hypothetical protein